MNFENMKIEHVQSVVRYSPTIKKWRTQNRTCHIIGLTLSGEAFHDFGYKQFTLTPSSVYFFNQREDYNVEVLTPSSEAFSIHFTTYEAIDVESFCIPVSVSDELLSILQKAESAKDAPLTLMSLTYRFLAEIDRLRKKQYFPKDKRMLDAKAYIDTHFCEKNCLDIAISNSGITARRFTDLFRGNFDITPNRYITFRRMEHAKALLSTGTLSVTDVADLCGYTDIYYFSKVFKKETGISPKNYR